MDLAETNYEKSLKNFGINKSKMIEEIEKKIEEAVAAGEWETHVRGAIDKEMVKHLKEKGYRVHVIARFDAYGRDFDGHLYIKWDCGSPLKRAWYRVFGI